MKGKQKSPSGEKRKSDSSSNEDHNSPSSSISSSSPPKSRKSSSSCNPKPSSIKIVSTAEPYVKKMREAFHGGQYPLRKEASIKKIVELWREVDEDTFFQTLIANIKVLCYQESTMKFTRECIKFVVEASARLNNEMKELNKDSSDNSLTFIETLCSRLTSFFPSPNFNVRFNTCLLLGLLMNYIDDMDDRICSKLTTIFESLINDAKYLIRALAARFYYKFQNTANPDDTVAKSYCFHLLKDSHPSVRLACINHLVIPSTPPSTLVKSTRDTDSRVRSKAYQRISLSFDLSSLSEELRAKLIRNIVNEKNNAVLTIIKSHTIPSLLTFFKDDLPTLLSCFDFPADKKQAETFTDLVFDCLLELEMKKSGRVEAVVKRFSYESLNPKRLIRSDVISYQHMLLWHRLIRFVQKNEHLLDPLDHNNEENFELKEALDAINSAIKTDEIAARGQIFDSTTPKIPLIYYLLPEFPHFCAFITRFVESVEDSQREDEGPLVLENLVFHELLDMVGCFEIFDSAQKNALLNTLNRFIHFDNLIFYFPDYIQEIIKCLSLNLFTCPRDAALFVSRARDRLLHDAVPEPESIANITTINVAGEEEEDQYARISEKICELREKLDHAVEIKNHSEAAEITKEIKALDLQKKNIMSRKLSIAPDGPEIPDSSLEEEDDTLSQLHLDEQKLLKLILLFSACLQFNEFQTIGGLLQTHLEYIISAGAPCTSIKIRTELFKCIGLACFVSYQMARKYLNLMCLAITFDKPAIKVVAIQSFFDVICEHGLDVGPPEPLAASPSYSKTQNVVKDVSKCNANSIQASPSMANGDTSWKDDVNTSLPNSQQEDAEGDESPERNSADNFEQRDVVRNILGELIKLKRSSDDDYLKEIINSGIQKLKYIKAINSNDKQLAEEIMKSWSQKL